MDTCHHQKGISPSGKDAGRGRLGQLRSARLAILVTLVVLIFGGAGARMVVLMKRSLGPNRSPWFGRGAGLPKFPYTIVVGPVDASEGLPGLIEIGMARSRVLGRMGRPLVRRLMPKEALRRRFIDPEDVANEFFDGVFAWVGYGSEERVISITFDLEAFSRKFGGRQEVVLRHGNQIYLLSASLSQDEAVSMLTRGSSPLRIAVQASDVIIRDSGAVLGFDWRKQRLRSVTILARNS